MHGHLLDFADLRMNSDFLLCRAVFCIPAQVIIWTIADIVVWKGTRGLTGKSDARVHTSSRAPIRSLFLYFNKEGPNKEVPPMKPSTEASERAAYLHRNRLNRQTSMPIGFESTPLQRTTDAGATSTIGDDNCTSRPPQVTLTMKTGAFTFIIHPEITSDIIRPR
ncbi:hypothetical protein CDL15_Pgr023837 [Punica granatum]|uniref:Uncharacterized protein n=1 Tax=Punica granatum TaxID=22663 RepID=A0A218VYA3_PUNGR|nr:hypothetical protein CDL15_Pgr023837 [Punica granatum]